MPELNDAIMPRIVQPIIFVINTSGSMEGRKCSYLNEAMEKTIRYINELFHNSDFSDK